MRKLWTSNDLLNSHVCVEVDGGCGCEGDVRNSPPASGRSPQGREAHLRQGPEFLISAAAPLQSTTAAFVLQIAMNRLPSRWHLVHPEVIPQTPSSVSVAKLSDMNVIGV